MMLSWVGASIIGSRLLLSKGFRSVALAGMVLLLVGTLLLTRVAAFPSLVLVMVSLAVMGAGMGLAMPAFLIAVQNEVEKSKLGTATAMLQFSRNIGGTLGVSVMGVILASRTAADLLAAGADPNAASMGELINGTGAVNAADVTLRHALAGGVASVFVAAAVAALFAVIVTMLAPGTRVRRLGRAGAEFSEP
jgi:MFS family permease